MSRCRFLSPKSEATATESSSTTATTPRWPSRACAEGNVYRLSFLAAPDGAYRLAYGSETAKAPSYDTLALRESLGRGYQPVQFSLAEQVAQPGVNEPPGGRLRNLLNEPFFLGGVILLLIVVLGWALYRAGRRIDQLPKY